MTAVVLLGLGVQDCGYSPSASGQAGASTKKAASASAVFGVDRLMKQPTPPKGAIQVEGIVASVDRAAALVGLIDVGEYEACGVVSCAALTLPVHWSGQPPKLKEKVRVLGEIKTAEGKLILSAQKMERVSPPAKGKEKGT